MSKRKSHHQRRRRAFNRKWLFDAILGLAQAAYFVARFLIFSDRE
ncbi:hypothetical protein [Neorhizobium galegae]|nr:hypothetical protein [Neorhizobium galegae]